MVPEDQTLLPPLHCANGSAKWMSQSGNYQTACAGHSATVKTEPFSNRWLGLQLININLKHVSVIEIPRLKSHSVKFEVQLKIQQWVPHFKKTLETSRIGSSTSISAHWHICSCFKAESDTRSVLIISLNATLIWGNKSLKVICVTTGKLNKD